MANIIKARMKKLFSNHYSDFEDAKFIAHSRSLSKFKALQNNILHSSSSPPTCIAKEKLESTFVPVRSATFKGQSYAITVEIFEKSID